MTEAPIASRKRRAEYQINKDNPEAPEVDTAASSSTTATQSTASPSSSNDAPTAQPRRKLKIVRRNQPSASPSPTPGSDAVGLSVDPPPDEASAGGGAARGPAAADSKAEAHTEGKA
eukprot:Selendium_serpulae@DN4108_c0_g1_i3.p2